MNYEGYAGVYGQALERLNGGISPKAFSMPDNRTDHEKRMEAKLDDIIALLKELKARG